MGKTFKKNHAQSSLTQGFAQSKALLVSRELEKLQERLGKNDIVVNVNKQKILLSARITQLRKLLKCQNPKAEEIEREIHGHAAKVSQADFGKHKH